jgi:hypothetical protein
MLTLDENAMRLKRRAFASKVLQLAIALAIVVALSFIFIEPLGMPRGVIVVAALALYLWFVVRTIRHYAHMQLRVVPYFERKQFRSEDPSRPVAEESRRAFRGGAGIASDLRQLDELAQQSGVTPLSHFGFGDDLFHQPPQWTDITEGKRTLDALIAKTGDPEIARSLRSSTVADLQALSIALDQVHSTQQRFAFLLRYGSDDFISGVEMERRVGSFWF